MYFFIWYTIDGMVLKRRTLHANIKTIISHEFAETNYAIVYDSTFRLLKFVEECIYE